MVYCDYMYLGKKPRVFRIKIPALKVRKVKYKSSLCCFFINLVFLAYFGELIFQEIDFVLIFLITTTCDFLNFF